MTLNCTKFVHTIRALTSERYRGKLRRSTVNQRYTQLFCFPEAHRIHAHFQPFHAVKEIERRLLAPGEWVSLLVTRITFSLASVGVIVTNGSYGGTYGNEHKIGGQSQNLWPKHRK